MSDRARLIGVIPLPIPLDRLGQIAKDYPKGSTMSQSSAFLFVRSPGTQCAGCHACEDADCEDFDVLHGDAWLHLPRFMIVCPDCGNKRCPKASHHDHACTGSNPMGVARVRAALAAAPRPPAPAPTKPDPVRDLARARARADKETP